MLKTKLSFYSREDLIRVENLQQDIDAIINNYKTDDDFKDIIYNFINITPDVNYIVPSCMSRIIISITSNAVKQSFRFDYLKLHHNHVYEPKVYINLVRLSSEELSVYKLKVEMLDLIWSYFGARFKDIDKLIFNSIPNESLVLASFEDMLNKLILVFTTVRLIIE